MNKSNLYKRLIFVSFLVCLSMSFFCVSNIMNNKVIPTNALPITNKIVVLDAGHGKPDEGVFLFHKENKQLTFYK